MKLSGFYPPLQICAVVGSEGSSSDLLPWLRDRGDLWGRWSAHMAHKRFEDYLTCPAEAIGRLGSMLGEGCYGRVYKLYRASGNNANLTLSHPTSCVFIEGHRGA